VNPGRESRDGPFVDLLRVFAVPEQLELDLGLEEVRAPRP
jgi:hypothetical protein